MAKLIVLRLHPAKVMAGSAFTGYLTDLEIQVFDASFADPAAKAAGAFLGSTAIDPSKIVQHKVQNKLQAVASAMVVLNPQQSEYAEPDIVLHVLRAGKLIRKLDADYNVAVGDGNPGNFDPTSVDPASVAAYVELPDPGLALDSDDAVIDLPKDGTAPSFTDLKAAVEKVLQQDPGSTQKLGLLTVAECRHIAHEIAWNRHVEPIPSASKADFEKMYTLPPDAPAPTPEEKYALQAFQGALSQYRAVHDAKVEALTRFIFALSAAIACEKKSAAAASAGLSFPIQLDASQGGLLRNAEVALKN